MLAIADSDKQMCNFACLSSTLLQQPKSSLSNRMRNAKAVFVCVCLCVCFAVQYMYLCVYLCAMLCRRSEDVVDKSMGLCIGSTKDRVYVHLILCVDSITIMLVLCMVVGKCQFSFNWECFEFDQSHKSIQSHLCMLTL